ncbi:M14 metallopeptidase family protein [Muriicola sp. SD30]|uniref:M14 family metallopeptidase n=1 Tax=Muriicola sp. SD30 TaxID=3240936 RepID=UPI00350FBBCD
MDFKKTYQEIKVNSVSGRYVHHDHLRPFLNKIKTRFEVAQAGLSIQNKSIDKITLGEGPVKILMWSQMHGNESTTTKAILDLLNTFYQGSDKSDELLKRLTLTIIPMLNPDGAYAYTRENANKVDLNRDAQDLSQPESVILRREFETFAPDFCFNLHDQRTIFSAGTSPKPATLSFLSPAADPDRKVTGSRLSAMKVISSMNRELQDLIPGQVGRYDDAFNPNCVGDAFQMSGTPTILVEAGHYPEDYDREETRMFVYKALYTALEAIAFDSYHSESESNYFNIPENKKLFFDFLIRNAQILDEKGLNSYSAGILFKEELTSEGIHFRPYIEKEGKLRVYYGHQTFDCANKEDLEKLRQKEEIARLFLNA